MAKHMKLGSRIGAWGAAALVALCLAAPGAVLAQKAQPADPAGWDDMVKKSLGYSYGSLEEDVVEPTAKGDMPQVTFVLSEIKYGSDKPKNDKIQAGAYFRQIGRNAQIHWSIKLTEVPKKIVFGQPMKFKAELKRMARFTGGRITEYSMFGRHVRVCAEKRTGDEFTNTAMGLNINGRSMVYTEGSVPNQPVCSVLLAHKGALDFEETVSIGVSLTPTDWKAVDSRRSTEVVSTYKWKHSMSGTRRVVYKKQKNPTDLVVLQFKHTKGKPRVFTELTSERLTRNSFSVRIGSRDYNPKGSPLFTNRIKLVYVPQSVLPTPLALQPYEHPSLDAAVASADGKDGATGTPLLCRGALGTGSVKYENSPLQSPSWDCQIPCRLT